MQSNSSLNNTQLPAKYPISSAVAKPEKKSSRTPRKMIRAARQMDILIFLAYSFPVMLIVGWASTSRTFVDIYDRAVDGLMVISTLLYIVAVFLCLKSKIRIPIAVYLSFAIHVFGCAVLLGWLPLYANAGQAMVTTTILAIISFLVPVFLRSNVV